ncbi:AraC family transcriptional regulator [Lentzea tibetensis]|uniref:AraC family transcriptional regulator n=1 Tax=Lentzea tibetensis TaxID=2591470 RepID=A0A563EQW6_9PSEU|nr:AraC family transcriptional regulator [Lentzea tibetensis]TWP50155.1 AraC family transcriptional regulator [Lentzea tibetensis]
MFTAAPDRIHRADVAVVEQTAPDELAGIQALWPAFERAVGLRGRKMYARIDERAHTYTACTPVKPGDESLRLALGTLPGGWYLRGRLAGEPSALYTLIGAGMDALRANAPVDEFRPLVEFYRRHDQIELWVPVTA